MQVSSAVIPAAGAGTRFLPATKAVPKELMPIGDTPAIQLIIDEALGAGIEHIVVVSSRSKPSIERYFERDDALIAMLREQGQRRGRRSAGQHRSRLAGHDHLPGQPARARTRRRVRPRGGRRPAVRRAAARRADGRLVAAGPDERRVRQHRRQRGRGQAGATRPGRARTACSTRRRRSTPTA